MWGPRNVVFLLNMPSDPSGVQKLQQKFTLLSLTVMSLPCLVGDRRMLKVSPHFKAHMKSKIRGAQRSEGALLWFFIIQWLLYYTIKNERKCINSVFILKSQMFSSFMIPRISPDSYEYSIFISVSRVQITSCNPDIAPKRYTGNFQFT